MASGRTLREAVKRFGSEDGTDVGVERNGQATAVVMVERWDETDQESLRN